MQKTNPVLPGIIFACLSCLPGHAQSWHMQPAQLQTRWAKEVSPTNALPEYPRPQMVRTAWQNLNGLWDYAITDSATTPPRHFDGQILVPYPLESALSGVKKTLQPNQRLWYHTSIQIPALKKDLRTLLHFGAVDWMMIVTVNGKQVGEHRGGYQSFTLDITNALVKGTNEILVKVYDPTDQGPNPHGKQVLKPEGIMYTPTSGIWQTVWLETVPATHLDNLVLTPDIDSNYLSITANIDHPTAAPGYTIEATARSGGATIATIRGEPGKALSLPITQPHLWSPSDPFLYDLTIKLLYKSKIIDTVGSYFGMRKIEIKKDDQGQERIYLNHQYTFNLGVLDQGFWPDGIYTAPTDAALRSDVEAIRSMGFNTIRKHIKIEPARWYYHCDRLGMLVWQDMPYPANLSEEGKQEFENENTETIAQLHNYPSIICWVLFNEGWNNYDQKRLTEWVKRTDPSRLVNGHSGENYCQNCPQNLADKWASSDMTDIHDYPGPGIAPAMPGKARVLGEWGGVRVPTPGHQWSPQGGWGYIQSTSQAFARKYEFMVRHLKLFEEEGLSASIYTQPFDVETEENGLITYDREVFKIPAATMLRINSIVFTSDRNP